MGFVGACWSELVCLVLEWASRGTLTSLMEDRSLVLRWDQHLLRLAIHIARGMNYLHGRVYFDEREMQVKSCILHRDLKPDNWSFLAQITNIKFNVI